MDRLQETLTAIQDAGGEGLAVQADVSQQADVERVVAAATKRDGSIDILINNAGIGGGASIHEHGWRTGTRSWR
jgi:3-oxoacyl-[acyl-carrier protein] reductase